MQLHSECDKVLYCPKNSNFSQDSDTTFLFLTQNSFLVAPWCNQDEYFFLREQRSTELC